ncbi:beta-galactosidase [Streptomyces sp. NPDC052043]|uniref:beta-galactosidase n=1 Tax=Streptomyces sp. NPDC052043 TaxID=3365684 RepID=UPI0037D1E875
MIHHDGSGTGPADRLRARLGRIAFGGDYNPEQWPEEVWAEDMRLMKEAAVSMVSVGIFSWAEVEPRPGQFDFTRFDRIMDNLAANDIAACLATMTASPPPWLSHRYPQSLPVRADGARIWPGARQQYCPSSPVYREFAGRLVDRVAGRYADHPALALWHVGNEYGCHISDCYCDVSAADFRRWLRERYGNLDGLNDAWSTSFWSQRYGDWDEILPPRLVSGFGNPAQRVDFARFSSDAMLDCFLAEKEILRRITPEVPVTTNFLSVWKPVDCFRWAEHQDVVSHDSYPDPHDPDSHVEAGFAYDLMRSLGHGRPWLLMEQAPSAVNWRERNGPKAAGLMRLGSWQAVAQGADSVMYFQWRQSRGGAEKYHSAMVPHGGSGTRTFREIRALGNELAGLSELVGSTVGADAALVMDWSSWWGLELDSHPSSDLRQMDANLAHYRPLFEANVTCDVVHPSWDLSAYGLVVVPNLYMVDEAAARNLAEYVREGGHLVVSFFSGIVDECDRVHPGGYPAPLRDLLGLRVEEFWPLPENGSIDLSFTDAPGQVPRTGATGRLWSEDIHLEGAQAVATFASTELAGGPAVTRHGFGEGVAWYLGTRPDPAATRALFDRIRQEAGVDPVLPGLPEGVQAVVRRGNGTRYLVLLNHSGSDARVQLPRPARDLLSGGSPSLVVDLGPAGVAVLATESDLPR